MFLNAGVFAVRNPPLKNRDAHIVARDILLHEADRNALGQRIVNPVEQMNALSCTAGQDQVADEHAAAHNAVFIIPGDPALADHFLNGQACLFEIVIGPGTELPHGGAVVLEVGKIDINYAVELFQGFHRLIAGRVPHQGHRRPVDVEGFQNLWDKGRCRDKGDGLHAHVHQAAEAFGKRLGRKGASCVAVRDISILTVDAPECAAGEKDGAGSALSGNRRLLPQMRGNPCDAHGFRHPAESMPFTFGAKGMAGSGAECACIHHWASPRMITESFRAGSEGFSVRSVPSR